MLVSAFLSEAGYGCGSVHPCYVKWLRTLPVNVNLPAHVKPMSTGSAAQWQVRVPCSSRWNFREVSGATAAPDDECWNGSGERVAALKQGCSTHGWGGLPRGELASLATAVNQLIDDMEDKQAVPDRSELRLLSDKACQ